MAGKFNDIAAVIATRDYATARSWYSRAIFNSQKTRTGRAGPRCESGSTIWPPRSPN